MVFRCITRSTAPESRWSSFTAPFRRSAPRSESFCPPLPREGRSSLSSCRLMEGLADMKPEMMFGSPWHEEYTRIAPNPDDFATLFAKKAQMDRNLKDVPAEVIESIEAPTLLVIGD